jgi:hypothetical protein
MALTLEAAASGAGGGTGCGCVWLGVLCEWCPPRLSHLPASFVSPIDWDWHRKLFTLCQLGKASRLGTGLRFGQAGSVDDDGLVCVCVCVCVLWYGRE